MKYASDETEKALLGIYITHNSMVPSDLDLELFTGTYNKAIAQKIMTLKASGKTFDLPILADELSDIVPPSYLTGLMNYVPHVNLNYLAEDNNHLLKQLKEARAKRELVKQVNDPSFDLSEVREFLVNQDFEDRNENGNIEIALEEYVQLLNDDNKSIEIGYSNIDDAMRGLRKGEVLLIMGRTTTGKTSILLNILVNLFYRVKETIGFFSSEMPKCSIIERLIQIYFDLSWERVEEKVKSKDEAITRFVEAFGNVRIYSQLYSIEELRAKIKSEGLKILFIDFLGLLECKSFESPYQKTTQLITDLKRLAKEENILIIVAHQLSRKAGDGSEPVSLDFARDSGAVEELSDFILGIWRPEIATDKSEWKDKICIRLLKNKRGATRTITCDFNKTVGKIKE